MMQITQRRHTKKGSALIITLLMITVIASVSFAVTALALSEFRKSANIQDSIVAYYAAESGLEHGLMEYRLWHDAEISQEVYAHAQSPSDLILPQKSIPTALSSVGKPQTFRLTGTNSGATLPGYVSSEGDKGTSWYDLKMFYRGDKVGEVDASGEPIVDTVKSPRVRRDSAVEYSIEGAKAMKFVWQPDPGTLASAPPPLESSTTRYFIELTFTVADGTACPRPAHQIYEISDPTGINLFTAKSIILNDGCNYKSIRIKPWNIPYAQYGFVLYDQPSVTGPPIKVDQLKTTFQSTGYSGSAKRTLELKLSRTIGTILESGDFLFLSGDKPLTF